MKTQRASLISASAAMVLTIAVSMASASATPVCVNTLDCTLTLTQANSSSGFGTGNFGTVHLVDNATNMVTVTVNLNSGWDIIDTGFPGSFGFTDSLSGTPIIGSFSSPLYNGSDTDTTQDLHFDGFGYFKDAAATSGPHNGSGLQSVSFTVTQTGLNDVNYLLNPSAGPAGDGSVYFVVDAGQIGGNTGLLAVTGASSPAPEPSYAWFIAGLGGAAFVMRRMRGRSVGQNRGSSITLVD